jgi:sugar phosphate isomerase/epimerase
MQQEPLVMKLACSTWNFTEELESGSYPNLHALVSDLSEAGFDGIEIMGYHLECIDRKYLAGLREHAARLGMCVSAIDARNLKLGGKWPDYRTDIALIKTWIEAAAVLECPTVVVFLGGFETAEERVEQLRRDFDALVECAEFARQRNVRLGIENHRIYLTSKDADPDGQETEDVLALMERIRDAGIDGIGTTPDNDNVFRKQFPALTEDERSRVLDAFRCLLPHAIHVHVKVKGAPTVPDALQFPASTITACLWENNYDGAIGFELMKPIAGDKMEVLATNVSAYHQALSDQRVKPGVGPDGPILAGGCLEKSAGRP